MNKQKGFTLITTMVTSLSALAFVGVVGSEIVSAACSAANFEAKMNQASSICAQVNKEAGFAAATCVI